MNALQKISERLKRVKKASPGERILHHTGFLTIIPIPFQVLPEVQDPLLPRNPAQRIGVTKSRASARLRSAPRLSLYLPSHFTPQASSITYQGGQSSGDDVTGSPRTSPLPPPPSGTSYAKQKKTRALPSTWPTALKSRRLWVLRPSGLAAMFQGKERGNGPGIVL